MGLAAGDPWGLVVVTIGVVFAMSTVHSMMGFAFGLLATPVLVLLLPPKEVVVLTVLLTLLLNALIVLGGHRALEGSALRRLAVPIVMGLPVGLAVLSLASPAAIRLGVGLAVVALALPMLLGWKPTGVHGRRWPWLAGLAAGILTTSINFNGPPIVLYLRARDLEGRAFRTTTAAALTLAHALAVVGFLAAGLVEGRVVTMAAGLAPVCLAGYWVGSRLQGRIEEAVFARGVLVAVMLLGLVTIGTSGLVR